MIALAEDVAVDEQAVASVSVGLARDRSAHNLTSQTCICASGAVAARQPARKAIGVDSVSYTQKLWIRVKRKAAYLPG